MTALANCEICEKLFFRSKNNVGFESFFPQLVCGYRNWGVEVEFVRR